MKTINKYITEKLKISKPKRKQYVSHTLFPETKEELMKMIKDEIDKNGNECSLNHIDTSKITDMSRLFNESIGGLSALQEYYFNCDISEWDVSNVQTMNSMFKGSSFNGDISDWDVSNVTNMYGMFYDSKFNGDIYNWDVSNVWNMEYMFMHSKFNQDISSWKVKPRCDRKNMFTNCEIKNKYKPKLSK